MFIHLYRVRGSLLQSWHGRERFSDYCYIMVWYGNGCLQGQPLPDGESSVAADQIIYSSVDRGHAGTYTCTGDNRAGRVATDSVQVRVKCEKSVTEGSALTFSYFQMPP